jgi:hypothetical protein
MYNESNVCLCVWGGGEVKTIFTANVLVTANSVCLWSTLTTKICGEIKSLMWFYVIISNDNYPSTSGWNLKRLPRRPPCLRHELMAVITFSVDYWKTCPLLVAPTHRRSTMLRIYDWKESVAVDTKLQFRGLHAHLTLIRYFVWGRLKPKYSTYSV